MTKREKIEQAKTCIDKLANGISPLDNTAVSKLDIINHVEISRCLFFVSDLLRQMIESGTKSVVKREFYISTDELSRFMYSDVPLPISEIVRRINLLIDLQSMKQLKYTNIVSWLIDIQMLKVEINSDGKRIKRPTDFGKEIGISVEERLGKFGKYSVVVYNRNAQQFVIDHIDAVIAEYLKK